MKLPLGAHTVASVLKSFFQQLPEAVVPPVFTQSFIKAYGKKSLCFLILSFCYLSCLVLVSEDTESSTEKQRILFLAEIINRMPTTNSATFKFLLKFLYKTSQKASENQMTARNLAIVWGPTTLRPSHSDTASMMTTNETCSRIMEFLITHWISLTDYLKA